MSDKPIPTLREILHTADGIKDRPLASRIEPEPPAVEPPEPEGETLRGGEAAAELARSLAEAQRLK